MLRPDASEGRALKKRLKVSVAKAVVRPDLLQVEQPLSTVPTVHRFLQKTRALSGPIKERIAQANLNVTVGTVFLGSALLGVSTAAAVYWLSGWLLLAVLSGAAATWIPYAALNLLATRRRNKFEEQFPEAIELLARALRAGHAFTTGLQMVADEMPEPVGGEFRLVYDRQAFGMQIADALRDMAKRVPLLDARFFVTAVLTQRESGGNLAEVLDNLARLMRERFTVKRQVRTLSAHGRMTAVVLGSLAPALALLMFFIAPEHMIAMVTDSLGQAMIGGALVLQVIGILVMRRIIAIEV
ncbi:MAG: type II secretion system F family protein [Acidobacteria bacterium]|nr:type II secretion system F family protein [Acidobacteriota bacterium]